MFFGDVPSANVVQRSVVGLSHHPVDRLDVAVLGIRERIVDQRVQTGRHAERVGQHDRGFDVSQFPDLRVTGHFAVTVADADGCRQLVPENIAGMGNDGRDARAYRVAFDQRGVADPDALHVRDRVERSGSENTVLDSVVAHPALAGKRARRHEKAERQKKCFHALLVWFFS